MEKGIYCGAKFNSFIPYVQFVIFQLIYRLSVKFHCRSAV